MSCLMMNFQNQALNKIEFPLLNTNHQTATLYGLLCMSELQEVQPYGHC